MTNDDLCPHCHLLRRGAHSCMHSMQTEIERLRADISQAYDLRDKAEGRYCTALGEIERLQKLLQVARDRLIGSGSVLSVLEEGLGFVELADEPSAQCGAKFPCEGETYTCTLKAGHGSGHGVIEMLPTAPCTCKSEFDDDCPSCQAFMREFGAAWNARHEPKPDAIPEGFEDNQLR